jgi:hypothetical protein
MSRYPNSGALFKNQKKTTESHPDYTGTAEIDGEDYFLSAWIKEGRNGKFMSLSFKPKKEVGNPARMAAKDDPIEDSEITF